MAAQPVDDELVDEDRIGTVIRHLEDQKNVMGAQGWVLSFQNQSLKDIGDGLVDIRKRLGGIEARLTELLELTRGDQHSA